MFMDDRLWYPLAFVSFCVGMPWLCVWLSRRQRRQGVDQQMTKSGAELMYYQLTLGLAAVVFMLLYAVLYGLFDDHTLVLINGMIVTLLMPACLSLSAKAITSYHCSIAYFERQIEDDLSPASPAEIVHSRSEREPCSLFPSPSLRP